MTRNALLLLLGATALAGCSTVGDPAKERPATVVPQNFVFAPPATAGVPAVGDALLPASDPAFTALMQRAANAPDLAIAIARIDAARAAARRAAAERLPRLDIGATAGVQRSNPNQFGNLPAGAGVDATRFSIGGDLNASWDVDLFGRLRASERAARFRLDAAGFDAEAVRIALVSEIAAGVSDWQSVAAQRAQLAANVAAAESRARLIRSRVRAGLNPELDAMRADAVIEALRAQLAPLDGEEAAIVARLVALTAAPAETVLAELRMTGSQWAGSSAPNAVPSTLVAARPDVQAAAARLAASDADLAAIAAQRFPRFTLSSALGLLAFSLGGLFDSDAITSQLGGAIAGPLLDFGRIDAEINQGKAQSRIALEELRKASFVALGEAEEGFGRLQSVDREVALLEAQAAREEDVAKVSASRYRAGLESLIAVLDADRIAYQARQQAVAAKGRALRARIELWQRLGGEGVGRFFGVRAVLDPIASDQPL